MQRLKSLQILDAAVHVFSEKGFANATVEDVAKDAGVGKGTVYLYYDSKEQLLEEVIAKAMAEFREGLGAIDTENLPLEKTLESYLAFTLGFARENHELAQFTMESGSGVGSALGPQFRTLKWEIVDVLQATVDRAVETGQLGASAQRAEHVVALIGGAIMACLAFVLQQERDPNAADQVLDPAVLADILRHGM